MKDKKYNYQTYIIDVWGHECEVYNLPYHRKPKNFKYMLKLKDTIKYLNKEDGIIIKRITNKELKNYDNYEDIPVSAYSERKSWKRNSKRKHQYKDS